MKINKVISLIVIVILFFSCAKEEVKQTAIKEKSLDTQMLEAYKEGKILRRRVYLVAKKFNEAEKNPTIDWVQDQH